MLNKKRNQVKRLEMCFTAAETFLCASSTYNVVKMLSVMTSDLNLVIKDVRYVWVSASENTQTYRGRQAKTHGHTQTVIKSLLLPNSSI